MRDRSCWIVLKGGTKKPRPSSRCLDIDEVGRGCEQNGPYSNREPGFFVIAVEKFFTVRPDWHQDDRAEPLVCHYQAELDCLLESRSKLRDYAVHCVHCGIRFLTFPCNALRQDLRCPFGCRTHFRRQRANARSAARYATAEGRRQKKELNSRRQSGSRNSVARGAESQEDEPRPREPLAPPGSSGSSHDRLPVQSPEVPITVELHSAGIVLDESSVLASPMLPYVRMLVSLLEGVAFRRQDLVQLVHRGMRQHSLRRRTRVDYVLAFLHQHPP